jgi:aryl-alcohol dehydrogenase-like predicted oxidoreductase
MEYRNLGRSGLIVSAVGLGCNNFGQRLDYAESQAVIHKALDAGITLFDTADVYGEQKSEEYCAKALGARRKDIVLATKFAMVMGDGPYNKGASRRYIMRACEASLKRLSTDYIDLYQQHRPDAATPIEETLRALEDLIQHGKVRYVGCSNFAAWQVVEAAWTARSSHLDAFVSCQDEWSLLERKIEAELVPAAHAYGMGILPFFPLASGLLTGKYRRNAPLPEGTRLAKTERLRQREMTDAKMAKVEKLADFVAARGHTMLELAMSWLYGQRDVASVIAGATKPEQIAQNVAAVGWRLSAEELAEIDRVTLN